MHAADSCSKQGESVFYRMQNDDHPVRPLKVCRRDCTRSSAGEENSCHQRFGGHYECQYFAKCETETTLCLCDQPRSSTANCASDHREHVARGCQRMFSRLTCTQPMGICYQSTVMGSMLTAVRRKHSTVRPSPTLSISSSITTPWNINLFTFLSDLHVFGRWQPPFCFTDIVSNFGGKDRLSQK